RGQIRKTIRNPHDSDNRRAACTGGGGGVKNPNSGFTVGPPFPAQSIIGNLRRGSRVRYAAPNYGAPWTPASGSQQKSLRRGKGGLWDIRTHSCPTAQRFVSDPPAVPRLPRTARRSFSSRCAIQTVSRPAGPASLKFNLRGRRYAVPANGCLVTLMRWPNLQRIQFGKPAQTVNPATVASPEILPISPRRCVFSLDKSLSWKSTSYQSFSGASRRIQRRSPLRDSCGELLERSRANGPMREGSMGFVVAIMNSVAKATMDFMIQDPTNADEHCKVGFDALWRALADSFTGK